MARPGAIEYNNFVYLRFLMSVNLEYLLVIQFWAREYWQKQLLRVTRYALRVQLFNPQLETRNSQQAPI